MTQMKEEYELDDAKKKYFKGFKKMLSTLAQIV